MPVAELSVGQLLSRHRGEADIPIIFKEISRYNNIIYIPHIDILLASNAMKYTIIESLQHYTGLAFFSALSANQCPKIFSDFIDWKEEFPMPEPKERLEIWRFYLPELKQEQNAALLIKLSSDYIFQRSQIESAIKIARAINPDGNILNNIEKACQTVSR